MLKLLSRIFILKQILDFVRSRRRTRAARY
jgi:hypothetical protein